MRAGAHWSERRSHAVRSSIPALLFLALGMGGTACSPPPAEGPARSQEFIEFLDHEDRRVQLQESPQRIISLVPSASEALLRLGAGDRLVGRTQYDTQPELAHLPSVGGGLHPSLEAILELRPDLVIRFGGDSDRSTPRGLDDAGIPHMAVRTDGVDDVFEIFGFLGAVVEEPGEARSLVENIREELQAVSEAVSSRPRIRVAYLLGGSPPWVAGPGTFIHELMDAAGGENAFSDLDELYGPISPELLLVRDIDLILTTEGSRLELPPGSPPVAMVPDITQSPGPDLGEAVWALAQILHPGLVRQELETGPPP